MSDTATTAQPTPSAADQKNAIRAKSKTFDKACNETASKKADLNQAKKNQLAAKKRSDEADAAVEANDAKKDAAEAEKESSQNEIDQSTQAIEDNNSAIAENNERIEELEKDGSPEAMDEKAALEEKNKTIALKNEKEKADIAEETADIKEADEDIKEADAAEDELDANAEAMQDSEDECEEQLEDAESDYSDAKEAEADTLDHLADEYPESYGKMKDDYETALDKEDAEKEQAIQEEKIKIQKEKDDKLKAAADKKIKEHKELIADYRKALEDPDLDIDAQNAIHEQILAETNKMTAIAHDPNAAINEVLANQLAAKMNPAVHNKAYLHWDSPDYAIGGKLEDIIAGHMQPKMKFAYMGEFPAKLEPLDWMVKSMDKPKVDIESVEQIRNNVKRNYPIKYNYGDLSVTFWDDMDHKTILTLYNYFSKDVWTHAAVPLRGTITLRDSILIPKFHIYELTTNTDGHLKYCFENAILSSFDFDNSEDESDDGVHTVQAVFKIERFSVSSYQSPRVLNPANSPVWL